MNCNLFNELIIESKYETLNIEDPYFIINEYKTKITVINDLNTLVKYVINKHINHDDKDGIDVPDCCDYIYNIYKHINNVSIEDVRVDQRLIEEVKEHVIDYAF